MKNVQALSDKLAIGLSFMCAFHCLVLPSLLVLLPSFSTLNLDNELFHLWMLIAVLPISAYALTLGCKKHQRNQVLILGALGLSTMVMAVLLESVVGEWGEKILTLTGACLLAMGHFWNYQLCRQSNAECDCSNL